MEIKTKNNRRWRKPLLISAVLISICVISAGAVMFQYYMKTESSHGVGRVWEITNNSLGSWSNPVEMGDYNIVFDTSDMVGGDSESFLFNITLNGNSNANKPLYFTLTNNYATEGVYVNVTQGALDVVSNDDLENSITFTPGEEKQFQFEVTLDPYTPSGSYSVTLLLEKN